MATSTETPCMYIYRDRQVQLQHTSSYNSIGRTTPIAGDGNRAATATATAKRGATDIMHYARSHDHEGRGYSSHHHIKLSYLSYYHLPSPHIFLPNCTHHDRGFLKRTQHSALQSYLRSSHLTSPTASNHQAKKRTTTSYAHLHEPKNKQASKNRIHISRVQCCKSATGLATYIQKQKNKKWPPQNDLLVLDAL